MSQPTSQHQHQHQQLLDLGSLDSSALPDLSLNAVHQPRLSLELGPTDLSISLPDVSSSSPPNQPAPNQPSDDPLKNSQQLTYDIHRHPSKRWTSFSELGKSVLRLKSFERSTIHSSSPYLRPRLIQIKPTPTYSTTSGSRHLFKLFHQDHANDPDTQPQLPHAASSCFTLPILPTMSESLSTSFDKELSSIADQPIILEEPADSAIRDPPASSVQVASTSSAVPLSESDQPQRAQSIVSSQSDPISSFATPLSVAQTLNSPVATNPADQAETSEVVEDPTSPTAVATVEEDATDQEMAAKSPEEQLEAEETKVEEQEVDVTKKGDSIEILNRSDESQSNEDPITCKTSEQPITTTTTTTDAAAAAAADPQIDQKMGANETLGRKKKFSQSASIFKLFIKGLGHLKPGHSSSAHHNDSSKTLVPTTTITNNH